MSNTDKNNRAMDAEAPETREDAGPGADSQAGGTEQIAALTAAVAELRDKFLRAVAESDNVRKRAEREIADSRSYAIANFARDVISVADNLDRALEAIGPDARAVADDTLKALLDGVDLTRRELQKTLQKHGVRQIDPKDEKFDPNFHQAMYEVADAEVPAGTVVQVMQTGYAIGERVLRPALVAIAKGGTRNGRREQASGPGEGERRDG